MTNRNKYRLLILMLLCSIAWVACTQERQPCLTPKIAVLNIECMHKITDTAEIYADTALPTALLTAFTNGGQQRFIYRGQTSTFTLSLSSVSDSCKWAITTDTLGANADTLTFFYERKLQFLSNACGYADFYKLTAVNTTHVMIDSVIIKNTSVNNNVSTKHLQVYIHPDF